MAGLLLLPVVLPVTQVDVLGITTFALVVGVALSHLGAEPTAAVVMTGVKVDTTG